ncbi:hypothetical protein D3C78_951760 [compost metagenome]
MPTMPLLLCERSSALCWAAETIFSAASRPMVAYSSTIGLAFSSIRRDSSAERLASIELSSRVRLSSAERMDSPRASRADSTPVSVSEMTPT